MDSAAASASAAKVLARHAAQRDAKSDVMPNVHPIPSKNSRVQAMQRLATQKGAISLHIFSAISDVKIER